MTGETYHHLRISTEPERLNSVKRGESIGTGSRLAMSPQYLGDRAEEKYTRVNHLIQEHGSVSSSRTYQITDNQEEVEEAIEELISAITLRSWISIATEVVFIMFVISVLSISVFLACSSIRALWSGELGGLDCTSFYTLVDIKRCKFTIQIYMIQHTLICESCLG